MATNILTKRAIFVRDGKKFLTSIIENIMSAEASLNQSKKEYIEAENAFISAFYLLLVKSDGNVHKYVILSTGENGFHKKTREGLKCIDSNPVFTPMTPDLFSYHYYKSIDLMLASQVDSAEEIVKKIKEQS